MPWRLYRYLLSQLIRVMLLTTAVLVTVIAFGAAIKPISQDLLAPAETVKYILLATIPMLQFALPFAAGFAATIVLHRMAQDNETTAMAVSGVSYRGMLLPVFLLGLILVVLMFLLSQWVIPRFWLLMGRTIAQDTTRLLVNAVERGETFQVGDLQIYADEARSLPPPEGEGISARFLLLGVATVRLDEDRSGPLTTDEFTGEMAFLDLYQREDGSFLKVDLRNLSIYRGAEGVLASAAVAEPQAIHLDDELDESIKFKTLPELMKLYEDNDSYGPVARDRRPLIESLARIIVLEEIDRRLRAGGTLEFRDIFGRWRYAVTADRLDGDDVVGSGERPVTVIEFDSGRATRRARGGRAELLMTEVNRDGRVIFDLLFTPDEVTDLRRETRGGRWRPRLSSLQWLDPPRLEVFTLPSTDLIAYAESLRQEEAPLVDRRPERMNPRIARLVNEIHDTRDGVAARVHQRTALSFTVLLLLMTGAVLAMRLRDSLPLTIYALAFTPAVLDILLISSGEQLIKEGQYGLGLSVMYSGTAILLAVLGLTWWSLSRN